jgi:hypothetical protein
MGMLKAVTLRNFKCFRGITKIDLSQSTYIVGPNNSGKTAILAGIHCFFDSNAFSPGFINKTELAAKKEGFNRSEISITFDLALVVGKARRKRLISSYGEAITITKRFTWREVADIVQVDYIVGPSSPQAYDSLNEDVRSLLSAVSVSYMHPQEGKELLLRAQEKFKQRLFHNWGRHASVADRVKVVQEGWEHLRATANTYLSSSLTERLQGIWPGADVKIDLPARIQDIVAISDITFRSNPTLPQVTLTSHGTGAQSTILFQTHYVLDSDRTLHSGMYFPLWLIEEPESFLHADIELQLARLLSSDEWLSNIQMVVSTHAPIILAASRQNASKCRWVICEGHSIHDEKQVSNVTMKDIENVGKMMGDSNFSVYFNASSKSPRVFLEDSRGSTRQKFADAGVQVTSSLNGISEVKKHIDVILSLGETISGNSYFIVDSDAGLSELDMYIREATDAGQVEGWHKYKVAEGVYIIALPETLAVEDLIPEWPEFVDQVHASIFCRGTLRIKKKIPSWLGRTVGRVRQKNPDTADKARNIIKKEYEVKERFWRSATSYQIDNKHASALSELIL